MADDSKKFEVQIGTTYDGSGAKAAAADLDKSASGQKAETAATNEAADATHGLDLKKRQLLESMRLVTAQFPLLGDVARVFFNETTLAIFGIIGAFELWKTRVTEMTQSLGAIELPDFSDATRLAQDYAIAFHGIADAVAQANENFNSAETTQKTATEGIGKQLEYTKKLIEAEKELAIARIDQQRAAGTITPAEAEAQKRIINQGATAANTQAEINARNAGLAANVTAADNLQRQANAQKAQADAITKQFGLGQTDQEVEAQKKASQEIIDARQKSIDASRANIALINEATDETTGTAKDLFDFSKLIAHYGAAITTPGGIKEALALEQQNINQNEAAQKEQEQQIARREEARKKRDELIKNADNSGAQAATLRDQNAQAENPLVVGSVAWQNIQDRAIQQIRDQTDQVGKHIEGMGNATAEGMQKAAAIAEKHTAILERHNQRFELIEQKLNRAHGAAFGPP